MRHTSSPARLAVLGAGAWGTVLAILLAHNGHQVRLWARRSGHAEALARRRSNDERLPGAHLPAGITVLADLAAATAGSEAAFLTVPSTSVAEIAGRASGIPAFVSCAKGLARPGLTRLSEVIARLRPDSAVAVLSGPNLAPELARGLPAAAVVASQEEALAGRVQGWLQSSKFRLYTSPDPAGAEVGGALKNIIALAAGMCDGLRLGDNAKAAIVTRGLVEMVRVGERLGARRETLYGLAGLGDLIATCSSQGGSRNRTAGERIALGATVEELEREGLTAEGIPTVQTIHEYAAESDLELPIAAEVYRVLYERKDPRVAIDDLMSRTSRAEW